MKKRLDPILHRRFFGKPTRNEAGQIVLRQLTMLPVAHTYVSPDDLSRYDGAALRAIRATPLNARGEPRR